MLTISHVLPSGSVLRDPAAGGEDAAGVAVGVPLARQQLILAPVRRHAAGKWRNAASRRQVVWLPQTT